MKGGPARWIPAVFLAAGLLAAASAYGYLIPTEILPPPGGGSGSYTNTIPEGGYKPAYPDIVSPDFVTMHVPACAPNVLESALKGRKVPTSDWWTPLAWVDPADLPDKGPVAPLHALTWQVYTEPLVLQPQKGGLALSLNIPDSQRQSRVDDKLTAGAGFMLEVVGNDANNKGISPYFNSFFDQDLYLGSTASGWNEAAYGQVKVTGWSDWFAGFEMKAVSGDAETLERMDVTVGNGSPFVLVKLGTGHPQVTFRTWNIGTVVPLSGDSFPLNAGQAKGEAIHSKAFAVVNQVPFNAPEEPAGQGAYSAYTVYAVFGPEGSTWTLNNTQRDPQNHIVLNTATCSQGSHYAVAVLPYPWGKGIYDKPDEAKVKALLAEFARYAFAEVTDSRVDPHYDHSATEHDVTATFTCETTALDGETPATDGTLFALYPHQYVGQEGLGILDGTFTKIPASSWSSGWYWPSLKGPMILASGSSFENRLEVPPCLPTLPDVPDRAKADRMEGYLKQALATVNPHFTSQGSYFGAQEMHRLAMLLPIAAMIEPAATNPSLVQKDARDIYNTVADALGYRLRATKSGDAAKTAADHVFYYDSRWGTLLPSPEDGFDASRLMNDHHFHFGYFIKAATELARWEKSHPDDPANKKWAEAYAPMVRLLIRDIANTDRNGTGSDPDFPFLRHFSPYTGHSWANGPSRGNVGGQQESTPEAIQAWAAILLWAQLNYPESPENADLERWAAYMFASEVKAARMYWFGFTEDAAFRPHLSFRQYAEKTAQVPKPYVPSMVSQIFQSEMTFQTCFGNAPLLKHGIQWLPLTGSSLYLGTSSADAEAMVKGYLENDLPKLANGGTPPSNKDKLLMIEALAPSYRAAPEALVKAGPGGTSPLDSWKMQWEIPAPTYENGILQDTSRGAMYWWISTLIEHGVPGHAEVGADHASAACFTDGEGNKVYTAWNPTDQPLLVSFSDGQSVTVPPLGIAHEETAAGGPGSGGCLQGAQSWMAWLLIPLAFPLFWRKRR
jgi:hypothetical protein